jgi:hypothetical protein
LPDNIQEFDCSFSFITGGLTDANFAGLNQLVFADFDGNAYNSSVPQAFSSLQSLTFLYIVDGFISGDLSYMIGMPSIREHWIDTNPGLGGTIPAALSTVATLESFSVTSCNFVGTIPTEFGNFGFVMRQLWMYDNALTGTIPTELGLLSTLRLLQLEGNTFTGSMPPQVCANTMFPRPLEILGADCFDPNFSVCSTSFILYPAFHAVKIPLFLTYLRIILFAITVRLLHMLFSPRMSSIIPPLSTEQNHQGTFSSITKFASKR